MRMSVYHLLCLPRRQNGGIKRRCCSSVCLCLSVCLSICHLSDRSFRYALPCVWNQFLLSLRQPYSGASSSISYSPIPSPITSSSSYSPLHIHNSFIPGLKTTCFTNPTPIISLLPPALLSRNITWTVSSELLGFCSIFILFFRFCDAR